MRRTERRLTRIAVLALATVAEALAGEGQPSRRRIVVSISDRKLALVEDGRVLKVFSVAVGARSTPSPTGTFTIVNRVPHPTHYVPGKVTPPGPANPLGTRWLGLSLKGYGIHGTNAPRSIGRAASHGCIRLRNRDVEELFELVQIGDAVEFRGETDEELARIFGETEIRVAKPASGPASPETAVESGG